MENRPRLIERFVSWPGGDDAIHGLQIIAIML